MTTMKDLDRLAVAMLEVTKESRDDHRSAHFGGGKQFCFHRTPRRDEVDAATGERLDDVLSFRMADEEMKRMWLSHNSSAYFTTEHFDGHPWILTRTGSLEDIGRDERAELVSDAWLARPRNWRRRG